MWLQRLEFKAREIIERVQRCQPVEDTLVECKRSWPSAEKAARRIAAHANGARGEPILWLIGIDEKTGQVHDVDTEELATWWPQVLRLFDEDIAPEIQHVFLTTDVGRVAAVTFETNRAPYVIRTGDEKVSREVPWRAGTGTRTARRSELLKMLVPASLAPAATAFELTLAAHLYQEWRPDRKAGEPFEPDYISVRLHGKVFIDPPVESVVLLDHRMSGSLDWNPARSRKAAPPPLEVRPHLSNQIRWGRDGSRRIEAHPLGVEHRHGAVYVTGAGEMEVDANVQMDLKHATALKRTRTVRVRMSFPVAGGDTTVVVDTLLNAVSTRDKRGVGSWKLNDLNDEPWD